MNLRKRFGQHFLCDYYVIKSIIKIIDFKFNEYVVEIGPGYGALTKFVAKIVDHFIAIEIDKDIVKILSSYSVFKNRVMIINCDARKVDFCSLFKGERKLLRIFGNIAYNTSISLLFYLINYINLIKDIHFMFQKEVADRLVAFPNCRNYGRLSVLIQYFFKVSVLLKISPTSFLPVPKVHSSLVRFIPRVNVKRGCLFVRDFNNLITVLNFAFNQRRKKIINSLGIFFSKKEFFDMNINYNLRAENLSVNDYCVLANNIKLSN